MGLLACTFNWIAREEDLSLLYNLTEKTRIATAPDAEIKTLSELPELVGLR